MESQRNAVRAWAGKVTSETHHGEILVNSPIAYGDSLIYLFGQQSLTCFDRTFERVRWRHEFASPISSVRPTVWRGLVLAGTQAGELSAFRPASGELVWSRTFDGMVRGIGVTDRVLYLSGLKGGLWAFVPPPRRAD